MVNPRFDTAMLEPPRYEAGAEPRPGPGTGITGQHPAANLAPAAKPAWQQALDKALAAVGGFVEGLVRKVRAQPPAVQYAVLGTIGLVVLLLAVLFFVLVTR